MPNPLKYKCAKDDLKLNSKCEDQIKTKIDSSTFDDIFNKSLRTYINTIHNQDQLKFAIETIKK
jgi:hypothetical protein